MLQLFIYWSGFPTCPAKLTKLVSTRHIVMVDIENETSFYQGCTQDFENRMGFQDQKGERSSLSKGGDPAFQRNKK